MSLSSECALISEQIWDDGNVVGRRMSWHSCCYLVQQTTLLPWQKCARFFNIDCTYNQKVICSSKINAVSCWLARLNKWNQIFWSDLGFFFQNKLTCLFLYHRREGAGFGFYKFVKHQFMLSLELFGPSCIWSVLCRLHTGRDPLLASCLFSISKQT